MVRINVILKAVALALLLSIVEVEAGEAPVPAQPQTIEQMTMDQLSVQQGRLEAMRDMMINQANQQVDQINANLKAIADEKAKRAKPEAKATK